MRVAKILLERGTLKGASGQCEKIDEIVLFDVPSDAPVPFTDARVRIVRGDISDRDTVFSLIDRPDISVFHLASVVSGGAELDFDLAMRVNLHGHLHLLEALRAQNARPRHIFASSMAVYGGAALPEAVSDATRQVPQTTYGMTKAVGELLVNDYSRKGFIDGRCARLAAVIVRPGKPNKAASSFVSGILREPLNGVDMTLPVAWETTTAVAGYRTIADNLVALHDLDGAALGDDRTVNLPNRTVTMRQMADSLRRVAKDRKLGAITVTPDPFVEKIVSTWPGRLDATRALELGLIPAADLDSIIAEYIADYL